MLEKVSILGMLMFVLLANQVHAESEWDQTRVSVDKVWSIQFNTNISETSVNNKNIYVTDNNKNKLDSIKLNSSGKW